MADVSSVSSTPGCAIDTRVTLILILPRNQIRNFRLPDTIHPLHLAADFRRQPLRLLILGMLEFDLQVQIGAGHHPNDTIRVPGGL